MNENNNNDYDEKSLAPSIYHGNFRVPDGGQGTGKPNRRSNEAVGVRL